MLFQRLNSMYRRFRETSSPSGILAVGLQATLFYIVFHWAGPILLLTVATTGTLASMFRNRKQPGIGKEPRTWRNAVANAGIATMLSMALLLPRTDIWRPPLAAAFVASLAATLSDTMSHELGVIFGGVPRLITSWRKVEPGENGGVTMLGTLIGIITALGLAGVASTLRLIPASRIIGVSAAAFIGNLFDSLLGATIERKGWIGNDGVNFCCVACATILTILWYLN